MTLEFHAPPKSLLSDPWGAWDQGEQEESWLISFIDLLSLTLALMVLLVGHLLTKQATVAAPAAPAGVVVTQATAAPIHRGSPVIPASSPTVPETTVLLVPPEPTPAEVVEPARATPAVLRSEPILPPEPDPAPASAMSSSPLIAPVEEPIVAVTAEWVAPEAHSTPEEPPENQLLARVQARLAGLVSGVRDERGVSLQIGESVLFATGKSELLPAARPVLQQLAESLREAGEVAVAVEGHTDDRPIRGRAISNWELSAARATAVTRFLIEQGLPPTRLRSVGYADTRPVADNATLEGRAQNRRVNLLVEFTTPRPGM